MPITSIGDRSLHFQDARQTGQTKTRLGILSQELASGRRVDLTAKLNGSMSQISALDRDIAVLDAFQRATAKISQNLAQVQAVLGHADDMRNEMATRYIQIGPETQDTDIANAGADARANLTNLIAHFNKRDGDRALFAGNAVDGTALASGDAMLADIVATIGPATDAATISAAIDTWFDDPSGGFAMVGYTGDAGASLSRKISKTEVLTMDARADGKAVKDLLRNVVKAAIADAMSVPLAKSEKAKLLQQSAEGLFSAATPLSQMQAGVGYNQEAADVAHASQAAQATSFSIARNDLILADPFETATLLQDMQRQLELQFASTARLSQLSLVNYL